MYVGRGIETKFKFLQSHIWDTHGVTGKVALAASGAGSGAGSTIAGHQGDKDTRTNLEAFVEL